MGFAKTLGRDYGTNYTKGDRALQNLSLRFMGGLIICGVLYMILFKEPNFLFPIIAYIVGIILLTWRYIKIEHRRKKK